MAIVSPWELLSRRFEDALDVIQRERCMNVAVVVTATTNPTRATQDIAADSICIAATGLRAIQRFTIQQDCKNARIGIVCYEEQRFQAFRVQKQQLLESFGFVSDLPK